MNKKTLIVLAVVALLAGGLAYYNWSNKRQEEAVVTEDPNLMSDSIKRQDLPLDQLPDVFPADLPLEKEVMILENYVNQPEENKSQATRRYISNKSLQDNWTSFNKYLKSKEWKIVASVDQSELKALTATLDKISDIAIASQNAIHLNLSKDEAGKSVIVDVTFTYPSSKTTK